MEEIKVNKVYKERSFEEDVEKKHNKETFFSYLKEEKLDVLEIIKNQKLFSQIATFNIFLKRMRMLFEFQVTDMLVFLDEEGMKLEATSKLLNFENLEVLKKEIGNKFRLKKVINNDISEDFID